MLFVLISSICSLDWGISSRRSGANAVVEMCDILDKIFSIEELQFSFFLLSLSARAVGSIALTMGVSSSISTELEVA